MTRRSGGLVNRIEQGLDVVLGMTGGIEIYRHALAK